MNIPFKAGNILLPKKGTDLTKYSVVACDQYTSEPKYWDEVSKLVGNAPSTLNLTLPEIYLEEPNVDERIANINSTMDKLYSEGFFTEYKDAMIYLQRTCADGKVREGLIGVVDLEDYSFEKGSQTLIRATEKTVVERIPPRVKIRKDALLELPHIMILIDDEKCTTIEPLANEVSENDVVYDFDLMQNGGHIKGYTLPQTSIDRVLSSLSVLGDKENFEAKYGVKDKGVLLFAMGDGNHSLATAKTCYEAIKETDPNYLENPARYALVEIVNLHSTALEFEAIHRVVFNSDVDDLISELNKFYKINQDGNGQEFELVRDGVSTKYYIEDPKSNIAVGSIQIFLDEYFANHTGKIDYIHGDDVVANLAKDGNIGFIFKPMAKDELFKTVIVDGALPRKTFSMGHSYDKRYYLEARKIK